MELCSHGGVVELREPTYSINLLTGYLLEEQKSHAEFAEDAEEVGRRNPFSLWSLCALREDK